MRLTQKRIALGIVTLCCAAALAALFVPRWQPPARAAGCVTPPAGIVSWWPGQNSAVDVVGSNNGTFAANTYAAGKVGAAFQLDGVDDFVDVGAGFTLDALTLEAWVYVDAATNTGDRRVISKDNYPASPRKLFALKSSSFANSGNQGRPSFALLIEGVGFDFVEAPTALTTGWHHLAGVRDAAAGTFQLWVDGSLVASKAPPLAAGPINSAVNTVLGRVSPSQAIEHFVGLIDEASIYNRALAPADIQAIFMADSAGKCLSSADLKIAKSANAAMVDLNGTVTYTITVTNLGAGAANNVVVTDALPSSLTYVPGSCSSTGGGVCGGAGNNRTISFASLAGGASATITLSATVAACLPDYTVIGNTASVSAATADSDPGNNSATANVMVCDTSYIDPYFLVNVPSSAGGGTINVFTAGVCGWTAMVTSGGAWLSIGATSGGPTNMTLGYSWLTNPGGPRQGTIKVTFASGRMFELTVVQGAVGGPYLAGGRVFDLTRTGSVPGVTMTFTVVSGPGSVPPPVLTDANGFWSYSSFVKGTVYQVRPSKAGYRFRLAFQQFSVASTNINFYQY